MGIVDTAYVKASREVHLTNLVEFSLRLDNYVHDSDDRIYFQNGLDRDFVKRPLRKLSSHGITVKILKGINLVEEKNGELRRGSNGPSSKWREGICGGT